VAWVPVKRKSKVDLLNRGILDPVPTVSWQVARSQKSLRTKLNLDTGSLQEVSRSKSHPEISPIGALVVIERLMATDTGPKPLTIQDIDGRLGSLGRRGLKPLGLTCQGSAVEATRSVAGTSS
jgi:hypothetical protein